MRLHQKYKKNMRSGSVNQRGQEGFTLIEVMISVFILVVGLLAMAMMHVMAIDVNGQAKRITESTNYAQSMMERLMATSYSSLELTDGYVLESEPASGYKRFTRVTSGTTENTKRIQVKVEWREFLRTKKTELVCIKDSI
ncbi:type IV pilus modification protein PilV [Desulfonema magnum]|uniref:Type IV pilus modification protein n=1 Tax=Desulfonema magnum TaxID=45655 RepID=A0A975GU42_9BACT|nr:type IV pilus modification protein PilV [Desulfonema magnum]QTA92788.1 Type IV pilus modification protein [Desulfonema magnum]